MHTKSYVQFIVQLLAPGGKIVCMHAIVPRSENGQNITSKTGIFYKVEFLKIKRKKTLIFGVFC